MTLPGDIRHLHRNVQAAADHGGAGAHLVDEQLTAAGAAAHYLPLFHTTIAEVAVAIGVDLDAEFSTGHDSPELGDPHRTLYGDRVSTTASTASELERT